MTDADKEAKAQQKRGFEWFSLVMTGGCLAAAGYVRWVLLPRVPAGLKGNEAIGNEAVMNVQMITMLAMVLAFIFAITSVLAVFKIRKKFLSSLMQRWVGLLGFVVGVLAVWINFRIYFSFL